MQQPKPNPVQQRILLAGIIGMPGAVLLGLGLQSLFAERPLLPMLADPDIIWSMIAVGVGFLIWEACILIPALRQKARERRR